jgi:hypothetical protein
MTYDAVKAAMKHAKTQNQTLKAVLSETASPQRCEPPEVLRGVDGWHWLLNKTGKPFCLRWNPEFVYSSDSQTTGSGTPTPAWATSIGTSPGCAAQLYGWRYVAPVPSPDALAALVRAGRKAVEAEARIVTAPTARAVSIAEDDVHAAVDDLSAALAEFAHIPER